MKVTYIVIPAVREADFGTRLDIFACKYSKERFIDVGFIDVNGIQAGVRRARVILGPIHCRPVSGNRRKTHQETGKLNASDTQ